MGLTMVVIRMKMSMKMVMRFVLVSVPSVFQGILM